MELCSKLIGDSNVKFVINEIIKQSKSLSKDVICAYNLFCDNHPELTDDARKSLDDAYILCKYMKPNAEDVISILLYQDYLKKTITQRTFMQYFSEKRYEWYHEQVAEACKNAPVQEGAAKEESVRFYIMLRVCDKMFHELAKRLNRKGLSNTFVVAKAYDLAKEAHKQVLRKSGVPYLVHPLFVADILADIGAESSVIAAALLHDVVEDTDYTIKDIVNACGAKVAQYVDAVTSVHKEYAKSYRPSEYQCDKTELDAKSFEKLVRTVASNREMIFALYIKAADRIHNLRTIDAMPSIKIHNKNDETQLDYLPLFKAFALNRFADEIEDLMWRATDIDRYNEMEAKINDMIFRNREFIDEFKSLLRDHTEHEVNNYAQLLGSAGYDLEINEQILLPYEIYSYIKRSGMPCNNPAKFINKKVVPLCDLNIILDPRDVRATLDIFVSGFVKMFESKIALTGRTITDFYMDPQKRFVFEVEDHYRNVFRCCIAMREDSVSKAIDVHEEYDAEDLEEDGGEKKRETINVQLRNGKTISMPKGSTVIDVAFAIHEEIGYAARSATINGHKATIYNRLLDGDRVVIEADTFREDGTTKQFVRHVRITWLNWVVTKRAKKKIIEFLSDKYEGDDPRKENEAQDSVVERIVDRLLEELCPLK